MNQAQKEMLQFCLVRVTELDERSAAFIRERSRKTQYELSEKQAKWLQGCYDKLTGNAKPRESKVPAASRGPNVTCPHCRKAIKLVAVEDYKVEPSAPTHGAQFETVPTGDDIPF